MADQVQLRGGSTSQNDEFTGAPRELSVDTTRNTVRVHNGATQGGYELASTSGSNFTGDLTLGTDKIVLNATDGSITATDTVAVTSSTSATTFSNVNANGLICQNPLASASEVFFRGRTSSGDNKISIYTDGSAKFTSNIDVGNSDSSTNSGVGAAVGAVGFVTARRDSSATSASLLFGGYKGSTEVYKVTADGSATFTGRVTVSPGSDLGLQITNNSGSNSCVQAQNTAGGTGPVWQGYDNLTQTSLINANGSATFAGAFDQANWSAGLGVRIDAGYIFMRNDSGTSGNSVFAAFKGGSSNNNLVAQIRYDGSAAFAGAVTSANSFAIQLEADDDTKYTATTDADGNETRVYNGAVLDVKERIQNVLARMDAIEANEITDDATDSALLTLIASLSSRLDDRDVQIAALTARIATLELS
jgi:hypothetical protein